MKILSYILALFVGTGLLAKVLAQDPVSVSPKIYKVLLDNDQVRVLDIRMQPGDKSPMHSHPNSVIYALSAGTVRFTSEDGKANEVKFENGQCLWRPAEKHEPQNVGKTEVHVIQIELKR
jgi:quercetin dioxygenase-like cupin family protein